ncbi:hypothetical protein SAVIM40S_01375 [Streptomyces avidinii]
MRLLTFTHSPDDTTERLGVETDGLVLDLAVLADRAGVRLPHDLLSFVQAGPAALEAARSLLAADPAGRPAEAVHRLDAVTLCAPLRPGKIIGVGLNYIEHVEESSRSLDTDKDLPPRPVLFGKPATAVTGPGAPILHNADLTTQLDWECELAVVIGRTAFRVSEEEAYEHVFGFSIVNDISARDQRRSGQWFFSKGRGLLRPLRPGGRDPRRDPRPDGPRPLAARQRHHQAEVEHPAHALPHRPPHRRHQLRHDPGTRGRDRDGITVGRRRRHGPARVPAPR